jgi:hypothetical protein
MIQVEERVGKTFHQRLNVVHFSSLLITNISMVIPNGRKIKPLD